MTQPSKTKKPETLVKGEVFQYPVEMPLTERELLLYADEIAQLDSKRVEIEQRHDSEKGQFKADMKEVEGRATTVFNRLRTKKEFKDVECYLHFEYFDGVAETRRVDTDEVVTSRRMTVDEYKADLPFPAKDDDTADGETDD